MDCMREWSERVNAENVEKVLALGSFLAGIPHYEKPAQMTLLAMRLYGEGIARSLEEGYVMLMEAYSHHNLYELMGEYDKMLNINTLPKKTPLYIVKEEGGLA